MKTAIRWTVLVVFCGVVWLGGETGLCPGATVSQEVKVKGFTQFRAEQVNKFNEFRSSLRKQKLSREDFQKKLKEYAKTKLIPAFLDYKKTEQGAQAADDIDREVIGIAVHLAEDDKLVDQILQSQKEPEKSLQLKLFAAEHYGNKGDTKKAKALIEEVLKETETKFPETHKEAELTLFRVAPEGLVFPEFPEWAQDTDGKPLRVADYRGKVLLIDFWASWCGPCREEAPNVVKAYQRYRNQGFEIIGISYDTSKDKFLDFVKNEKMTWRQYFDGLGWDNKVGKLYGINAIPAMYLLNKEGRVITNNARGPRLVEILEKELGGK